MTQHQVVRAIYHAGTLQLLEPVDLPDGVELQVTLPVVEVHETSPAGPAFPTRPADPDGLRQLCSLIAVGGDALVDSEVLDDAGGD
jgi:hypothetical protein